MLMLSSAAQAATQTNYLPTEAERPLASQLHCGGAPHRRLHLAEVTPAGAQEVRRAMAAKRAAVVAATAAAG